MAKRIYNQTALFGPLYAYLAVISPPADIISELKYIKGKLPGLNRRSLQSTPHITLFERLTDDRNLADTVHQLLVNRPSFDIRLSGFTAFEHSKYSSIVLPVEDPMPITQINGILKENNKTPFLTFAKWLSTEECSLYMDLLAEIDFAAMWRCSEILVLRKLMSEKHLGFREKITIKLTNLPPQSKI
jgi:hypothetical protein